MCISQEIFQNNEMNRSKIFRRVAVLDGPDGVNKPCLNHDTRLCQIDTKMTNNEHRAEEM